MSKQFRIINHRNGSKTFVCNGIKNLVENKEVAKIIYDEWNSCYCDANMCAIRELQQMVYNKIISINQYNYYVDLL